jgi:hypothetical protein
LLKLRGGNSHKDYLMRFERAKTLR